MKKRGGGGNAKKVPLPGLEGGGKKKEKHPTQPGLGPGFQNRVPQSSIEEDKKGVKKGGGGEKSRKKKKGGKEEGGPPGPPPLGHHVIPVLPSNPDKKKKGEKSRSDVPFPQLCLSPEKEGGSLFIHEGQPEGGEKKKKKGGWGQDLKRPFGPIPEKRKKKNPQEGKKGGR